MDSFQWSWEKIATDIRGSTATNGPAKRAAGRTSGPEMAWKTCQGFLDAGQVPVRR